MTNPKSGGRYIRETPNAKPKLEERTEPSDGKLRDGDGVPLKNENPPEPKPAGPEGAASAPAEKSAEKPASKSAGKKE